MKKTKIVLIIGIIVVILSLIGGIGYYYNTANKNEKSSNSYNSNEKLEYEEFNYDELKYQVQFCKIDGRYETIARVSSADRCDEVLNIPTKTEDAKVLDINTKFVLYEDEVLKIYNIEEKKYAKINLENEYYRYNIVVNGDTIEGIIYTNQGNYGLQDGFHWGYYNIKTNKKLYDNEYDSITPLTVGDYIVSENVTEIDNQINVVTKKNLYILSTKEEKIIGSKLDAELLDVFSYDSGFIKLTTTDLFHDTKELYTKDFKIISSNVDFYDVSPNKKLYVYESLETNPKNELKVYDINGNIIRTYSLLGNVAGILYDYYISGEMGNIYIRSYDGFELKLGSGDYSTVSVDYHKEENNIHIYYRLDTPIDGNNLVEHIFDSETRKVLKTNLVEEGA